jgi:hypothetical protein
MMPRQLPRKMSTHKDSDSDLGRRLDAAIKKENDKFTNLIKEEQHLAARGEGPHYLDPLTPSLDLTSSCQLSEWAAGYPSPMPSPTLRRKSAVSKRAATSGPLLKVGQTNVPSGQTRPPPEKNYTPAPTPTVIPTIRSPLQLPEKPSASAASNGIRSLFPTLLCYQFNSSG